jgi:hypothetical protein
MNDEQSQDKGEAPKLMQLAPQRKARLYAAMKILMEFLTENGYLTRAGNSAGGVLTTDQLTSDVPSGSSSAND